MTPWVTALALSLSFSVSLTSSLSDHKIFALSALSVSSSTADVCWVFVFSICRKPALAIRASQKITSAEQPAPSRLALFFFFGTFAALLQMKMTIETRKRHG